MRASFLSLVPIVLSSAIFALAGGCSSNAASPKQACKPGQTYFCKCADLSDGEKLCKDDGQSFEACMQGDQPCPGGEGPLPDQDGGVVIDNDAGVSRDSCPGQAVTIEPGKVYTVLGDTTLSPSNQKGSGNCGTADGPENIFAGTPTADGRMHVQVQALHDVITYARTDACDTGKQIYCSNQVPAGKIETLDFAVTAGKTYWFFVDGAAGQLGKYTVTAQLNLGPRCTDGVVQDGEACDDGNQVDDDGCSNACVPNGDAITLGPCPGVPVHVWANPVSFIASTSLMGNNFKDGSTMINCGSTGVSAGDRVYAVTAHKTGTMTVTTTNTNYDNVLYVSTSCPTSGTTLPREVPNADVLACSDSRGVGGETLTFPVTSGSTYYVFVDGYLNKTGTFTLNLSIQ